MEANNKPGEAMPPENNEAAASPSLEAGNQADDASPQIKTSPQPKLMEVHKHPHHVLHKKELKEYFLEFFMIFFAVFLGFLAENIREEMIESHREKVFIKSLVNDLKTDTAKLAANHKDYQRIIVMQDSMIAMLPDYSKEKNLFFLRNFEAISGYSDFIPTDATILQLKNSGAFRLIKDHRTIDSIMVYDAMVKSEILLENRLNQSYVKMDDYAIEILNRPEVESKNAFINTEQKDFFLKQDKASLVALQEYHCNVQYLLLFG